MRWFAANTLRTLAGLIGAGIVVLAAWQNATYWHHTYRDNWEFQYGYVAASIVTDALKLIIPAMCALYGVSLWRRGDLAGVFVLCLVISFAGGIGYQQMTKDAAGAGTTLAKDKRADLDSQIEDAEAALAKLGKVGRPTAVIAAELATAEAKAGRNRGGEVRCKLAWQMEREECKAVAGLTVELATEQSRAELGPRLVQLRKDRQTLPAAQRADPMAASIGAWLRGVGLPVSDDAVARGADVLRLLLLELCPAALAVFVFAPPKIPAAPVDLPQSRARQPPKQSAKAAPATKPAPLARKSDLLELVRTANKDAGGWIDSTQEAIGGAIGCSKAHANRQIKDLVARGLIESRADKRGTRLRLVPRPANVVNMRP